MLRYACIAAAMLLIATLGACSPPDAPEEERRPEPRAAAPKSAIVDTANAYKDAARRAVADSEDAAAKEKAALDAAAR